ncbi:MAG: FGGY family carbohydrate kinase [Brevinema sp.]
MLVLGIDLSTQSCTLCVLDTEKKQIAAMESITYRSILKTIPSAMDAESLLVPAGEGCAEQDPQIFLYAFEEGLSRLQPKCPLSEIKAISISAQQHGHVYLNEKFNKIVTGLSCQNPLAEVLKDTYAHPYAPIWRSSDTKIQADALRAAVGDAKFMIERTGSDSPLRFTGAVIKKFADNHPQVYQNSAQILLLNTWLAAILSSNPHTACDFGNAAGTSLMDYSTKTWDKTLVSTVGKGLEKKLPALTSPNSVAGTISLYFQQKYNFSPSCVIGVGTGDNPASKVLSSGDILSLGTSFVYMKNTDINTRDYTGTANAMFDGLGNPFTIFCRTNGAMVWDKVRELYHADYKTASQALANTKDQFPIFLWQEEQESVPISPILQYRNVLNPTIESDYRGIVLSSLCLLHAYTATFGASSQLAVTGGPVSDPHILQLIAQIWECPVTVLPQGGAALGAALTAITLIDTSANLDNIRTALSSNQPILPDTSAYPALRDYKVKITNLIKDITDAETST